MGIEPLTYLVVDLNSEDDSGLPWSPRAALVAPCCPGRPVLPWSPRAALVAPC